MSEQFDLDRETNIANNIDATGKKWVVHTERGRHLFFTRPDPDRADLVIPDNLQGKWTKKALLDEEIKKHVQGSWAHADHIAQKNARKAQAAKEAKANAKKEDNAKAEVGSGQA